LSRGEFNIIAVDWAAGAKTINYFWARKRVKDTGRTVANFIKFLVAHGGLSLDSLTLVGHSLGAHVAGFAGKFTHGEINTIFGLDPAGPLFSLKSKSERLSECDAKYVETIVTDGGYLGK
jgi:pancreatic triacylglycerol lipase